MCVCVYECVQITLKSPSVKTFYCSITGQVFKLRNFRYVPVKYNKIDDENAQ